MPATILHLADLHLGASHSYLGDRAPARAKESDGVLERVAAWLTGPAAPKVGAVLIAGDLFDDPRPGDALAERTIRALRQIEDAGIATVTLPGNHDEWTYPDGVFRRYETSWPGRLVTEAEPTVVTTLDLGGTAVEVVSCAFNQGRNPSPPQWKSPLPATRERGARRVGLFHGTLTLLGSFIAEGPRAFPLDLDRLAAWGLDYLALGHIHKRQDFRRGSCLALYPGPIEGFGFADGGSPVMTIVDLSGETAKLQPVDAVAAGIRLRNVAVLPIEMAGVADEGHLESKIAEAANPGAPPPIVKVLLRGRPAFAVRVDEIRRKLAGSFEHLEIEAESVGADLGAWEALAEQRTLEGIFVAKVLSMRAEEPDPERAVFWDEVAEAGLRALGRGER
jgi:DNA repair exonuclease SbcCD nuclease subunit